MADRRLQQMQVVLQAQLFDLGIGGGVELRARRAVLQVNLVYILHQLDGFIFANMLVQGAAELVRDIIFPIGKRASAAEAVHDGAGLAVDAGLDLLAVDGTFPLVQRIACLENGHAQVFAGVGQLVGGVNAAGASADDNDVVIHMCSFFPCSDNSTNWSSGCVTLWPEAGIRRSSLPREAEGRTGRSGRRPPPADRSGGAGPAPG